MRRTGWYIINFKARANQTPLHYVEAIRRLKNIDPLVIVTKDKCVSIGNIEESSENSNNVPSWIIIKLISYTIIDPTKFYNRRSRENLELQWDSDVVANKKEEELIFVPSCHKLATKRYGKITLNYVLKYFSEALNKVEPNTFDVNLVVSRVFIEKIKNAHAITQLKAAISFSNPGHTNSFTRALDEKLRETDADKATIELIGSKSKPLGNRPDGLISALTDMAEQDGTIEAMIQSEDGGNYERVSSSSYPRIISVITNRASILWGNLYNAIINSCSGHD